eukprot:TRINITY_DN1021_c0_g1_i1.p1 TRINITY_DN1021_c0_g1~~TRINITY_DN1021_c0_g1_i1.p1  ORF type:complete len:218 (+),score=55.21 TRINITY_DN1021_c0_g1_i1:65-718(+)
MCIRDRYQRRVHGDCIRQNSFEVRKMVEPKIGMKITPDDILKLDKPTKNFLCRLADNVFNIQFLSFRIRDMETNTVLFEVRREKGDIVPTTEEDDDVRRVRYHFGPDFFRLKTVGTTLEFCVGDRPVKKFRMIERHYFREKLLRSYDFEFPFCIPNSTNTWESIYDIPPIDEETMQDMINYPWETKSDSFYFVDGKLIMHNKAEYSYAEVVEEDDNN